ncbi:hypothetical protein D9611_011092 [Ephemerocybe angulata]|uniref:Uncharacterized protein n=1 Tax=Ephemerocybe angulata TaxID=980116 RepID=A0A8H5F117_9AGAR|nr:hypothetical protein D9611_011092 [Tulosesus angulatus]
MASTAEVVFDNTSATRPRFNSRRPFLGVIKCDTHGLYRMPAIHRRGQYANESFTKLDILFISSWFIFAAMIFGFLFYKGYTYLRRRRASDGSRRVSAAAPSGQLLDRHSSLKVPEYGSRQQDEKPPTGDVTLVGVWMSDDINPRLIHRLALSDANPKTLASFSDKQGYLYVFSDPELGGEEPRVPGERVDVLAVPVPALVQDP